MIVHWLDEKAERFIRQQAQFMSRRNILRRLGAALMGVVILPALPVFRGGGRANAESQPEDKETIPESGDPNSCSYWRHCAIDGYLCGCCGGSMTSCPPGTVVSDITWIGTCRNPDDGKDYVISYNDCCGKSGCGNCGCQRDEGDTPIYRPQNSNNLNWCSGSQADVPYHCSLSVVIGVVD